jgi:DmsE family decaheme c-type cytochrome
MRSNLLAVLLWVAALAAAPQDPAKPAAKADTAKPEAAKPEAAPAFAGSEACATCHEDIANAFAKNPHKRVDSGAGLRFRGLKDHACESCHGPGQKHTESISAEDIRNPAKLTPGAVDKMCLTCHINQPTHVGRLESSHAKDQVACTSCHKIHANGPAGLVARRTEAINAQCGGCHLSALAQFQKPSHHRVPEGAMSCVDCHNPHGSTRPKMTQVFASNEPGCLNCHGDKRGPFAFEHAPVRFESCATCHEPHGSANPRMLVRQEVRLVCLECHAAIPGTPRNAARTVGGVPPAFHNLLSPRFQNCTVCHQKVHGSHVDRNLLR